MAKKKSSPPTQPSEFLSAARKAHKTKKYDEAVKLYGDGLALPALSAADAIAFHRGRAESYAVLDDCEAQAADLLAAAGLQAEEIAAREAELDVINLVQSALGAEMDMQAIYDLVGDKIHEICDAQRTGIFEFDLQGRMIKPVYTFGNGERVYFEPSPLTDDTKSSQLIKTGKSILEETREGLPERAPSFDEEDLAQSAVFVPLKSGDQVWGAVTLQNTEREYAFDESDLRLLETLADGMSLALSNARHIEEIIQRNAELDLINSVQSALMAEMELQGIYDMVGDKVRDIFDAQSIAIMTVDQVTRLVHLPYGFEKGERVYSDPFPLREESSVDRVVKSGETVRADTRADFDDRVPIGDTKPAQSALFVPLRNGEDVWGTLTIQNVEREFAFDDADQRLLETLASSMSLALSNARHTEEITARNAELDLINSVQSALMAELDLQAIYDLVGDKIRDIFDAQAVLIMEIHEGIGMGDPVYGWEKGHRFYSGLTPLSQGGPVVARVRQGESVLVRVAEEWGDAEPFEDTEYSLSGIFVPMKDGDRVWGAVSIQNTEREYAFDEADLRLLDTLASSMSLALNNARHVQETEQRNAELGILSSIQSALAAELDTQAIFGIVGDALHDIFPTRNITLGSIDLASRTGIFRYTHFDGERVMSTDVVPTTPATEYYIREKQTLVILENVPEHLRELGVDTTGAIGKFTYADLRSVASCPMVVDGEVIGFAAITDFEKEHAFGDEDIRLLETLTNAMAVAFASARRFEETQQQNAELTVINSIQQGLVANLSFHDVIDLVGDRLRDVFDTGDMSIRIYDEKTKILSYPYIYEHGERLHPEPEILGTVSVISKIAITSRKPVVINQNMEEDIAALGAEVYPGTDLAKSLAFVPLIVGDRVTGVINLEDHEKENAFGESELRLLDTVANALSIALESARRHEETQQRNAELAVINAVQDGLVAAMDMESIYDLVGDEIRKIFGDNAQSVGISTYDLAANQRTYNYLFEKGTRHHPDPLPIAPLYKYLIEEKQTFVVQQDLFETLQDKVDLTPGTEVPKSAVWVPLMVGSEVQGVVSVQNIDRENAFSDSEIRLLETLANSMSVALESAQRFEETQKRNIELAVINTIQHGLVAALDMQSIYELVGEQIQGALDGSTFYIQTFDDTARMRTMQYLIQNGEQFYPEPTPYIVLTEELIRHKRTISLGDDAAERERYGLSVIPGTLPCQSCVFVPLIVDDRVVGMMSVQNVERSNAFSDSDVRLLETLANSMSVALESARRYEETQQRNAELAVINSVQQGLAAELDFAGIVEMVGDQLVEIFKADTVWVGFHDEEKTLIDALYYSDKGTKTPIKREWGKGIYETVIERDRSLILRNRTEYEAIGAYYVSSPGAEVDLNESALGVPIYKSGKPIGVVSVQHYQQSKYDANDLRLLETLTNSMSVALENARLFDETTRLLEVTQQRSAEQAVVNAVQHALASKLEMAEIYELVGDQLVDIFKGKSAIVCTYDLSSREAAYHYLYEEGKRFPNETIPFNGFHEEMVRSGKTIVYNENLFETVKKLGFPEFGAGEFPQSALNVPLIIDRQVIGHIALEDMRNEQAFSDSDARLLETLANAISVAMESAQRFEAIQQRNAELAVINTVQDGLVGSMDMQSIYDLVGDKVRDIFDAEAAMIVTVDQERDLEEFHYYIEKGERAYPEPRSLDKLRKELIRTREMIHLSPITNADIKKYGLRVIPGTERPDTMLFVPLMVGNVVQGYVSLQALEANAYAESDVSLLQTLANSMSVALESARRFEETQQRNAELAVINAVQEGLVAAMDMQSIYDLVGDKIRDIFNAQSVVIVGLVADKEEQNTHYLWEKGERYYPGIIALGAAGRHLVKTRETLHFDTSQAIYDFGMATVGDTGVAQSGVWVPLLVSGTATGYVSIQNVDQEHAFADSDVRLLQTLANSMSVALESARLFEETQQRNAELAIINSIQAGLAAKLDFQAIIDLVGDKVQEIFDAQAVLISLYDSKTKHIDHRYLIERDERIILDAPVPIDGFRARVVETGEAWLINSDYVTIATEMGEETVLAGDEPKSLLFVPMQVGGTTTGIVSLQNLDREDAFSESDVRLLQTLSNSMSVALESARLFEETKRLLEETEQRNAELAVINTVQEGLVAAMDMQSIYDLVGDKIRDIFDAQILMIQTFDLENKTREMPYYIEQGERHEVPTQHFNVLIERLVEDKRTLVLNGDPETMAEYGLQVVPGTQTAKSLVFVPLMVGDQVQGMISLQNIDREEAFGDSEIRLLQTLANSMSLALEGARLLAEVQQKNIEITDALEQQTATGNILRAIAGSPTDVEPVLNTVAQNAVILSGSDEAAVFRVQGDTMVLAANFDGANFNQQPEAPVGSVYPVDRDSIAGRAILDSKIWHVPDLREIEGVPLSKSVQKRHRAFLAIPLIREGRSIGVLLLRRMEARPFDDKHIALVQTFADQAVIAIENVRLFDETQRLLVETQQRNAELGVITAVQDGLVASVDTQSIYELVGQRLHEDLGTQIASVVLYDPTTDMVEYPYFFEKGERIEIEPHKLNNRGFTRHVLTTRQPFLINNNLAQVAEDMGLEAIFGELTKSYLGVPLMIGGQIAGVVTVQNMDHEDSFGDSDVRLLQTLSNSMSVALQSARRFEAIEQRNAELAVINAVQEGLVSRLSMQEIYDMVGDKIGEVFEADTTLINRYDSDKNLIVTAYYTEHGHRQPVKSREPSNDLASWVITNNESLNIRSRADIEAADIDPLNIPSPGEEKDLNKSGLFVPMRIGRKVHGVLSVQSHKELAFDENDLRLLSTIAASTGVALESARLFEETQQRNAELAVINTVQEGLVAQLDMEGIYELVGEKIREVFKADTAYIVRYEPETNLISAPYFMENGHRHEVPTVELGPGLTSHIIKTGDALLLGNNEEKRNSGIDVVWLASPGDDEDLNEAYLGVPIRIGREVRGVLSVQSHEQYAFDENDVRLLSTIAASTGVALENARLFDEIQTRTREVEEALEREQATSSILNVLASSPSDVQPVLDAIAESAAHLSGSEDAVIAIAKDGLLTIVSHVGDLPMIPVGEGVPFNRDTVAGRSIIEGKSIQAIHTDHPQDSEFPIGDEVAMQYGYAMTANVPLMREGTSIGGITIRRKEPELLSDKQIELLQSFADQAVIAIENTRLFNEIQELLKETQQRNAELGVINSVQEGLVAQMDIDAIYELVGEKIRDVFEADTAYIARVDRASSMMHFPYYIELGQRHEQEPRSLEGGGLTAMAIRDRSILNYASKEEWQAAIPDVIHTPSPGEEEDLNESYLAVPIRIGRSVTGVISVQSHERAAFDDNDVRLLTTIANSTGVALENARLFAETQQRNAEMATVNEVSQVISTELDFDKLIHLIGELMRTTFAADIAYVALYNEQTNLIEFPYNYGESFSTLKVGEGLTSRILTTGEPLLLNQDVAATHREMGIERVGVASLSYLGVPIRAANQTIGVVSVQSTTEEGRFDEDDQRLLSTMAGNIGAAIRNAQLYQETQHRAGEMSTLAEIGSVIASTHELEPVLEQISQRVMDMMNVQDIALYLKVPEGEEYHAEVVLGSYVEEIKNSPIYPGKGVTGNAIETREGKLANFRADVPQYSHIPGTPRDTGEELEEVLMSAPLLSGGEVTGAVTVWRLRENGIFRPQELDFLISVARQVSIAIDSARLYLELERRASQMAALAEVGRDITATLDINAVLERMAIHARDLLFAGSSTVFLREPDNITIKPIVAVGDIADAVMDMEIRVGQGIVGSIIQDAGSARIEDTVADPRRMHITGTAETEHGERMMVASLVDGDRAIGAMAVWRDPGEPEFTEDELSFLNGLARQAVIAIHNANLFEQAEEARAAAVKANEAKSTFLANMSHELRTPLNAIIGFTRIVRRKGKDALEEKQIENLDKVLSSAEHLLGLINTILDIAKIEAGRMDVQISEFELKGVIDLCATTTQPLVQPGVDLNINVVDALPVLSSDLEKVKQILLNLLSNAAKFTRQGEITMHIANPATGIVSIAVQDTGIGIAPEALERIFEEFQQADTSTTREYGGTGLGLSISRGLSRLLGGDLTAHSVVGEGATFTLILPVEYDPESMLVTQARESTHIPRLRGPRKDKPVVLAIDDDPDVIYLLQEDLTEAGYQVVGAMSGDEGIALARELKPLVITLDIMMPNKDGWQVLHDLKADEETKDIPVVLLTIVDKKALGFRLGAADYLLKPFDGSDVQAALERLVRRNGGVKPKKLLIVDDDPDVIEMVYQLLEDQEYELSSVGDGKAALSAIETSRPDAILLDLMMPKMDGFSVIEKLRENPDYARIPVVVLTAKLLSGTEENRLRKSVTRVIQKQGLEAERLISELNRAFAPQIVEKDE